MRWEMSAATVNAYYHPFKNIIVFPAAILQAPFYSLKQSSSQNYGGIGAVIAHEISHAFDNNGSLFDEFGNLNNWWTDEDSAHFKQLAQKMIEEFDGIPFAGQKVNGKLTVSENIADAGGLSCAKKKKKNEADFNAQEFFINYCFQLMFMHRKNYVLIFKQKISMTSTEHLTLSLVMKCTGHQKIGFIFGNLIFTEGWKFLQPFCLL